MIILFFISFSTSGKFDVKYITGNPALNLYFLDQGFLDVSMGKGIIGASINPAVLSQSASGNFYIGIGGFRSISTNYDYDYDFGELDENLHIPIRFGIEETGGLDFLGFSKKIGPFVWGFSYQRGFEAGLELDINGGIQDSFYFSYDDTFTHSEYSDIPEQDTIPVHIPIYTYFNIKAMGNGSVHYTSTPIFFGIGGGNKFLKFGIGTKIVRQKLYGDIATKISGSIDSVFTVIDTSIISPLSGDTWRIDSLRVMSSINMDSIISAGFRGRIGGFGKNVVMGGLLNLNFIRLGLVYEWHQDFDLAGWYLGNFSVISGMPGFVTVDTTDLNIDAANNTISGRIKILVDSIPYSQDSTYRKASLHQSSISTIRAAINLKLWVIKLGAGVNVDITSHKNTLGDLYIVGSAYLPLPKIKIRLGVASNAKYIKLENLSTRYIPSSVLIGLGTGYNFGKFRVDIGVRTNLSLGVLSLIKAEESKNLNIEDTVNIGFGLSYNF